MSDSAKTLERPDNLERPDKLSDQQLSDEMIIGAPKYVQRTDIPFSIVIFLWLALTPWAFLIDLQKGALISFASPFILFIWVFVVHSKRSKRIKERYVSVILSSKNLDAADVANRTLAEQTYEKSNAASNWQVSLFLTSIVYLAVLYVFAVVRGQQIDFGNLESWLLGLWNALRIGAAFIGAFLYSACFVAAVRRWDFKIEDLEPSRPSDLDLSPEDRNDIDIAGLGVALQALMRRAETYTIESTLFSALSFSAFVGIAFSDLGPIENGSWLENLSVSTHCYSISSLGSCLEYSTTFLSDHIMYAVSFTLLLTAVLFISALVIRFRFNEAYRHVEEILSVAIVLNEKEGKIIDKKSEITREIKNLLDRAGMALDDLRPLGSAMKFFRNCGVFFFVLSVSLCGLYYGWVASVFLYGVVTAAYVMSYVDGFRRKSGFLPKLESVVMSVWHRRR